MSVRREPWGRTRAGEPVELYTLEEGALRARFTSFGATLVALEVPDGLGVLADVVLGFDTLAEYESPRNRHFGGVVGRCANRIAGASFELAGRAVELSSNEGRNHLHGGSRGFDRVVWRAEADSSASAVRFLRRSPDGEQGYPGSLDVAVTYTLGDGSLQIEYAATTDAPTVCNLTQHSYFNLAGAGTILDHELEIAAERFVEVDEELLPTGALLALDGTPFDFRSPERIGPQMERLAPGRRHGFDVCYSSLAQRVACRLSEPGSGRTLTLTTTQPGLQLYTGNHLDGLAGKRGSTIPRFGGLCLEAQHLPDSVHHARFPAVWLHPDETYSQRTCWSFPTAGSELASKARLETLEKAMDKLAHSDPTMARVVELHFFRGLSLQEIAKTVDLPLHTLERRLAKTRAWLRGELG